MLPHQPRGHLCRDLISVDDLLSGLDYRFRIDLDLIEKPRRISPGRVVFSLGVPPDQIYVHRSGHVAVFHDDGSKHEVQSCPAGPNCIYGLIETLSSSSFGIGMGTITNCEFDLIDRDELLDYIRARPPVCFRLAEIMSRLYTDALEKIKS